MGVLSLPRPYKKACHAMPASPYVVSEKDVARDT